MHLRKKYKKLRKRLGKKCLYNLDDINKTDGECEREIEKNREREREREIMRETAQNRFTTFRQEISYPNN